MHGTHRPLGRAGDGAPPTNKGLLVLAGVLLAIPIVALLWVSSYARETPKLGGVPFFFWYQFLWVFITAGTDLRRPPAGARRPQAPHRHDGTHRAAGADGEDQR